MNIPKYPDDFFDFTDGHKITDEEINSWIARSIKKLEDNPRQAYTGTSCGNATVKVDRLDPLDGKYEIFVSKSHSTFTVR